MGIVFHDLKNCAFCQLAAPANRLSIWDPTHCDPNVRSLDDDVQEESHQPAQPRFLVQSGFIDELVSNIQNSSFSISVGSHCCSHHTAQFPIATVTPH